MGSRGEGWVLLQMLLLALVALLPFLAGGGLPGGVRPLGALLMAAALLLFAVASLSLGSNLTPFPRPIEGGRFVGGGAYRLVRHPIYLAVVLGAVGWALWWGSAWALLFSLLLFGLFDLKSRAEERWLREKYPEYAEYSRRVRRLIPGLY